ncbi:hypothetical protein A2U94_11945 [Bacillus sp. VT 712]|uniref:hypothetical protein n=1 Tax=Bacillaceae TaxID=186817 RepID=UPI0004736FA5|nr:MULTISPECIES: hypothetical protein [Bacillaceae]KZB91250.1 hypothetical protein A2U94_11945 [Bacillus sp. VT 712]
MKREDRLLAEKVLKYLLIGSQVDGVKFGPHSGTTILNFSNYSRKEDSDFVLSIETTWNLYPKPTDYPSCEEEVPNLTEKEQFQHIWSMRREKVVKVELGNQSPHLIIHLESNKVLFVNGHDPNYECWQLEEEWMSGDWLVVAAPGDEVAVWCLDGFEVF